MTGRDMRLEIGIVGGSIAGCLTAIELAGAGHRVTVFERSTEEMTGLLGAGLGTPTPMFRKMIERGLVDSGLPHIPLEDMAFVGRSPDGEGPGRVALVRPLTFVAFHWDDLHRGLRSRVPDEAFRAGSAVADVATEGDSATIRLEDGGEHSFDLVVAADGYSSGVRRSLFGAAQPEYHGYVCWRGVIHEREMDAEARSLVASRFARFGGAGLPGSFLYPVPHADGSTAVGERLVNWGCYVPVPADELGDYMVDTEGHRHRETVPPGRLRADEQERLRALAIESLPPAYADIVCATPETFVQAVFSVKAPEYHRGRICLAGDAGAVAPPFTGSGIFKAASNAMNLRAALDSHEEVDAALDAWGATESATAAQIVDLGRQYDAAFIADPPDFGAMDDAAAAAWWRAAVTHPAGFTFEAEDD